ncbi:MAG: PEP-CTERM sorting domain-containing protein [Planctomycetaceae bacterium]
MMNTSSMRRSRAGSFAGAVAVLVIFFSATLHASIIDSGDLLTVSSSRTLKSYTFDGTLIATLPITGLPLGGISGQPQGVSVIDNRLFIGLVSASNLYSPKIVEVNPTTGGVISTLDTVAPHLTALGDDGTNLLLLDSVPTTPWQVYTYSTSGTLVSQTSMDRHFPLNFQGEGIDSDGTSIFMSGQTATYPGQPVITNTTAGLYMSDFNTNMLPLVSFIGGLAYDQNDDTLWIAGNSEFRQFSRTGTLLSVVNTGLGNDGVTGLEIISPSILESVPEPSSLVLLGIGTASLSVVAIRRRRQQKSIV